jgi:lipooligosaccharide transport system permease protein
VLGGFEWTRVYYGQVSAPLRVADILDGHLAFVVFRTITSAGAFLLIATCFGTMHSWWALATLPIAGLVGLAVATPTFAYASTIKSDSYLAILFRVGMIPMSLFSGVFFPVESLPGAVRWIAYVLPLWHAVDLSRAATLGIAPSWSITGHLLYLAAWAGAGWWLAYRQFSKRLVV